MRKPMLIFEKTFDEPLKADEHIDKLILGIPSRTECKESLFVVFLLQYLVSPFFQKIFLWTRNTLNDHCLRKCQCVTVGTFRGEPIFFAEKFCWVPKRHCPQVIQRATDGAFRGNPSYEVCYAQWFYFRFSASPSSFGHYPRQQKHMVGRRENWPLPPPRKARPAHHSLGDEGHRRTCTKGSGYRRERKLRGERFFPFTSITPAQDAGSAARVKGKPIRAATRPLTRAACFRPKKHAGDGREQPPAGAPNMNMTYITCLFSV